MLFGREAQGESVNGLAKYGDGFGSVCSGKPLKKLSNVFYIFRRAFRRSAQSLYIV